MNEDREKQPSADAPSELRQDPVSGEWVVIATGRAKRPHDFVSVRQRTTTQSKDMCPFERMFPAARGVYRRDGGNTADDWFVQVVPNKYPAFVEGACPVLREDGPYRVTDGIGFHEIVITRDHERPLGLQTPAEADLVLQAYQDRFRAIKQDPCIRYISVFHNHGPQAGATIEHPHSQIIALPVIPPDISRSIAGSQAYGEAHGGACVHCAVLKHELRSGERVVYENKDAVVLAPFASKTAFELRIMPRTHGAYFENAGVSERQGAAEALAVSLDCLFKGLGDPDYNFFLHTAPVGHAEMFSHYHWHIEIIPKTAVWAGFEIGTGIEISSISPEEAALFLKTIHH
ncbi:MAG: DUF4921 family protein [Patescibacteria group bacterium]